ncbi:hypothetical protein [Bradyrhizobium sp. CCGUVB23]|uniref:hypothetical protein n=1 Tax=Bradyrhizobium sp. CCGUVB23 TaxID=2949630 RepID=UPI0020B21102|nr:hypothetical protein [Bradyrhizobium sp. CCGUVB23]MCP3460581.1 hypothetical protein [Bradyrhizobium sp. CCGUVB23]
MAAEQRAYLLYRYELLIEDEPLDERAQATALKELQGQFYPSGPKAERDRIFDTVLMRPRGFKMDEIQVLTWSVGSSIQARIRVTYDKRNDELNRKLLVDNDSLKYADFVAVPDLVLLRHKFR